MRVKFRLDTSNNVTIITEDQDDTNITVESDGSDKIIIVTGTSNNSPGEPPNIGVAPEDDE